MANTATVDDVIRCIHETGSERDARRLREIESLEARKLATWDELAEAFEIRRTEGSIPRTVNGTRFSFSEPWR